jgi:hypothetical protein
LTVQADHTLDGAKVRSGRSRIYQGFKTSLKLDEKCRHFSPCIISELCRSHLNGHVLVGTQPLDALSRLDEIHYGVKMNQALSEPRRPDLEHFDPALSIFRLRFVTK